MMTDDPVRTTVRRVGDVLECTLPPEIARHVGVSEGDEVILVPQENGMVMMTSDPALAEAMTAYEHFAHRYRGALGELAK